MEFVGKIVKKEFKGFGVFEGVIDSYDSSTGFFKILYEDGDSEEVDFSEVARLISSLSSSSSAAAAAAAANDDGDDLIVEKENSLAKRVGRKPKRRRRNGRDCDSGKGSDNLVADDNDSGNLELNGVEIVLALKHVVNEIRVFDNGKLGCVVGGGIDDGLDLNRGLNLNLHDDGVVEDVNIIRGCIDLNVSVENSEFDESSGGFTEKKKERGFDLNLGFNDETVTSDANLSVGGLCEESKIRDGVVDANAIHVNNSRVCEIRLEEDRTDDAVAPRPREDETSGRTKRRKVTRNLNSPTETVLRRSARRAKAVTFSESDTSRLMEADVVNDSSMSGVSNESEEKPSVMYSGRFVEPEVLPPKKELPPSSTNLNLDGIPVVDIFSVYSCLRSFSTLLYLSPFELEDLVAALKSKVSSLLIDFIHVSILQTLRKHLEFLANEGCESASTCLRNLNWDLLDVITWPIFMVGYLLIHGSALKPGFSLDRLKLFDGEYYKQPADVKLELLRCLCDDVIEVEAFRSELSKRKIMADGSVEIDRTMGTDLHKKRRVAFDTPGDSCLSEDVMEEVTDGNSDECCLCKMDGNLICCDGCPAAYHSKCVGIVSSLLPEGDWHCPECVIGRLNFGNKPQRLSRGAELLGKDSFGRLYFCCFDYLLVSDSYDAESSFHYYHKDDLGAVIQVLQSSDILYGSILRAISQYLSVPSDLGEQKDNVKCNMETENPLTSSEGSAEVLQENQLIQNASTPKKAGRGRPRKNNSNAKQQKKKRASAGRCSDSALKVKEEEVLRGQSGDGYVNRYSFAQTAASVVEELLRKPSDKVNIDIPKTEEEIISIQSKFILKKSIKCIWPTIQDVNVERQKEKCGWCYCCRFPVEDRNCLFSIMRSGSIPEGLKPEVEGVLSKRDKKGHLVDVICLILCMEERLRGLLLGPWLSPHYSELWRKNVLKASDVSALKRPLLLLESSLRPLALSADWWKHVDTVKTMGSSSHFVANPRATAKNGISKKKGRYADSEIKSLGAGRGLSLFWWRGGKVSRSLFNWKVVPRSLALKAARKAGCIKIPGIQYPDGSENARRSNYIAWRASVETSTSLEQLALQVRELDLVIRWDDIENTHPLSILDKESVKSIRLFKKVIIRRKCVEGTEVKYLIDFGKRRSIPDLVLKHGQKIEDSSGERKKYWLGESYVPLHLLKSFEDRRITRKASKTNSSKVCKGRRETKKPLRGKRSQGFEYLFSRAERADHYQCGHCNKNVPISEAVCCRHCNGFFHKRHVIKSSEAITAGCTYTCHRCRAGKLVKKHDSKQGKQKLGKLRGAKNLKVQTRQLRGVKNLKVEPRKYGKTLGTRGSVLLRNNKKMQRHVQPLSQKNTIVTAGITLRRSARKATFIPLESHCVTGAKKRKRSKFRKTASKGAPKDSSWQKSRTPILHTFWINGLQLSRKPKDERVVDFKRRKLLVPSEFSSEIGDQLKCSLCSKQGHIESSIYIACQLCGDWFHGSAYGLNEGNVESLVGFKCHVCRERTPPVCPFFNISMVNEALSTEDTSEAGTQDAQELSDVVTNQKETNCAQEFHQDISSPGLLEVETLETSDGNLDDKTAGKDIIVNAIESQNGDLKADENDRVERNDTLLTPPDETGILSPESVLDGSGVKSSERVEE